MANEQNVLVISGDQEWLKLIIPTLVATLPQVKILLASDIAEAELARSKSLQLIDLVIIDDLERSAEPIILGLTWADYPQRPTMIVCSDESGTPQYAARLLRMSTDAVISRKVTSPEIRTALFGPYSQE